ncbi:MAG: hypothetical protein DMF20_02355 [Verrucomicrobia bacterium]|nr:MAG: hypothetical protein DMF20_02355 [Verrucomicrobiota bacterium]
MLLFLVTDTIVILNPTAGSPEHVRSWQERSESLAGDSPVRVTSHSGEAEALARCAVEEGFTRIVAAGGDGTVSQVAGTSSKTQISARSICQLRTGDTLSSSPGWDWTRKW